MDIDLLKSTPDDQIEMMLMTMHMDNTSAAAAAAAEMGGAPFVDTTMMSFSSGGGSGPYTLPNSPTLLSPHQTNNINFSNNGCNNTSNVIPSSMLLPTSFSSSFNNNNSSSNESASSFPSGPTTTPATSQKQTSMAAMREMIFRIAAMQPIYIDPEAVKPPKRRNVRISKDPQSVAARHRREKISERIRILQRLVPGGTKMDTASMLDEAIHYVKFLKTQVQSLERAAVNNHRPTIPPPVAGGLGFPVSSGSYFPVNSASKPNNNYSVCAQPHLSAAPHNVQQFSDA